MHTAPGVHILTAGGTGFRDWSLITGKGELQNWGGGGGMGSFTPTKRRRKKFLRSSLKF